MRYSQPSHTQQGNLQTTSATNTFTAPAFEYIGKTALTVIGNVTRKRYRFSYPQQKQIIDARDAEGMLAVPVLKKVS